MATSDREVFERFLTIPDLPLEVALLAYASYAAQKYDWIDHVEARDGRAPAEDEVSRWIGDLPEARLDSIRTQASANFDLAANTYLAPVLEKARKDAVGLPRHNGLT